MFQIFRSTDDFPDLLLGQHGGKLARFFCQTEANGYLLVQDVGVKKAQPI